MTYDISFVLWFALLSSCFSLLLNYALGKPGGEFSPYEIFSFYTVWLSKRRLIKVGLYSSYINQLSGSLSGKKKYEQIQIINDFNRIIYNAAEPFFTWERAFGMCIICTGFWISLIISILAQSTVIESAAIIVISQVLIRVINKFL